MRGLIGIVAIAWLIASINAEAQFDAKETIRKIVHDAPTQIHIHAAGNNYHMSAAGLKSNGYYPFTRAKIYGNPASVEVYSPTPMTLRVTDITLPADPIRIAQCDGTNICVVAMTGRDQYLISTDHPAFYKQIFATPTQHARTRGIFIALVAVASCMLPMICGLLIVGVLVTIAVLVSKYDVGNKTSTDNTSDIESGLNTSLVQAEKPNIENLNAPPLTFSASAFGSFQSALAPTHGDIVPAVPAPMIPPMPTMEGTWV